MLVPVMLFLISGVAGLAALSLPGWSDFALLAGLCVVASLILLARAAVRRPPSEAAPKPKKTKPGAKSILIDGSNVLYWKDGTPQLDALREVVKHLTARGYAPGVVFDANVGYLIAGKYHDDRAMGALIGLPEDRVLVVPKGSTADPVLLVTARDLGARIVTNDRYRDWAGAHPEVSLKGHLVKGGFGDTGVWLDLGDAARG